MLQTILLIEDNPLMQWTLTDMIEQLLPESHVSAVATVAEGMAIHATRVFDLIMTDYQLPDANGIDLALRVRRVDRTTPIVLITGGSLNERLAYAAGVNAICYKPIAGARLMALFEQIRNPYAA